MRVVKIQSERLELSRIDLTKALITVGADAHCDVFAHLPVPETHRVVLKWEGEAAFNPSLGQWWVGVGTGTTYDLFPMHDAPVRINGLVFQLESDPLHLSFVSGQFLEREARRDFDVGVSPFADVSNRTVLRCVQVSRTSRATMDIGYYRFTEGEVFRLFECYRIKCHWIRPGHMRCRAMLREGEHGYAREADQIFELPSKKSFDATPFHLLRFDLEFSTLYLSFIPEVPTNIIPSRSNLGKKAMFGALCSVFLLGLFFALATAKKVGLQVHVPPPKRVELRVKIVNQSSPKKPESPAPPPVPEPLPSRPTTDQKVAVQAGAVSSGAFKSKVSSRAKVGLNSPGKIKKVNQVGSIRQGASRADSTRKNKKVNANMVMKNAVVEPALTGSVSDLLVERSPAGVVDFDNTQKSSEAKGNALVEASTTFASDKEFNADSQLALARKDVSPVTSGREAFALVVRFGSDGLVQGGLTRAQVAKVLNGLSSEVRQCYEAALASRSNLQGSVRFGWTILASGKVSTVAIKQSEIEYPKLTNCISTLLKGLSFPVAKSKRPTVVEYAFNFRRALGE